MIEVNADVNVERYANQLRKLAADSQSGVAHVEIKKEIDNVLISASKILPSDKERQHAFWSGLHKNLNIYLNNKSDPRWAKAINYSRLKIKLKMASASRFLDKNIKIL